MRYHNGTSCSYDLINADMSTENTSYTMRVYAVVAGAE